MFDINQVGYASTIRKGDDMNIYPNILTPPSSNEESPQTYMVLPSPQNSFMMQSPASNSASPPYLYTVGQNNIISLKEKLPYLTITEQPTDKFRFRYKSEMAGTHGSLTGLNSDKTRKTTYPTVRLHNFSGEAVVRCSLYQHRTHTFPEPHPHAHRLIRKHGSEEVDDPHDLVASQQDGYEVSFHSMGIIHTAKKHIVGELSRKIKQLKEEMVARQDGRRRNLTTKEEVEVKTLAEEQARVINLNIVCLRFDAFKQIGHGVFVPICEPVYSHPINNLKSALTGELKIVRMDHSSSPTKGGKEIYMLVEKVTKKNIKIRFFEMDDEDNEIWSDFAKFSDLDVHHQYAIVFRTPSYRDMEISHQKNVFVELLRPSDGSRSEPREFVYFPTANYRPGTKRSRVEYSSSESWGNSVGPEEIPLTVEALSIGNQPILNSSEIEAALKDVSSDEFNKIFTQFKKEFFVDPVQNSLNITGGAVYANNWTANPVSEYRVDAPRTVHGRKLYRSNRNISATDQNIVKRVHDELDALLKTNPKKKDIMEMLYHLLTDKEFLNDAGENALHLTVIDRNVEVLKFFLKLLVISANKELLNLTNHNKEGIMHLALQHNHSFVEHLLHFQPDLSLLDTSGNTVLHIAIRSHCPPQLLDLLLRFGKKLNLNIDAENYEEFTAILMAVKMDRLDYIELLYKYGANINLVDRKNGYTILHTAILEKAKHIVQFLLKCPNIDVIKKDFSGKDAYNLTLAIKNQDQIGHEIHELMDSYVNLKGIRIECTVKEETEESEDDTDMEEILLTCKTEKLSPDDLRDLYKDVNCFTSEALQKLAEVLDKSGNWHCLCDLLSLGYMLETDLFTKAPSPTKALLKYAENFGDVLTIRNYLENLEEHEAVSIIDNMVTANKAK